MIMHFEKLALNAFSNSFLTSSLPSISPLTEHATMMITFETTLVALGIA